MEVRQRKDLWTFAVLMTALQMAFLSILQLLFYPADMHSYIFAIEPWITMAISMPLCLYLGGKMHENYLRRQELRRLVDRDRLTDVATRDCFYEQIGSNSDAYGVSLMVDIDHFKQVNDTHGHQVGDAVIRQVAQVLVANCRKQDIVCRFGGEEFVIFLHEATPEQGADIAERMRSRVAEAPVVSGDVAVAVTVSIGGSLKEAASSIDAAIGVADAALYQAKTGGRNKAVLDWNNPLAPA